MGTKKSAKPGASRTLMVRLDDTGKEYLLQAARLRQISISDYVRTLTVAHAKREVEAARQQTIAMTATEQLAFWNALNAAPRLTPAQRRLAATMRGDG